MIDTAKIIVEGGKGGDGLASFRREKYVPKGGPDGGDGGRGGNIILKATREINTLRDQNRKHFYKAQNGRPGGRQRKTGACGDNLTINLPIGTLVKVDNEIITDLISDNQEYIVAKGGKGGRGNTHFSTSTHQVPREFEKGAPGEKISLELELKLIADVGLVGLPNAGKSSLISAITKAKPKVADYPFTTLEPVLGVADYKNHQFVIADIPGLIEGAAQGKGLGDKFLKHIDRTKIIIHMVSATSTDPVNDYYTIKNELMKFSKSLIDKPEIIVISQIDRVAKLPKQFGNKIFTRAIQISAQTHKGLDELQNKIIELL